MITRAITLNPRVSNNKKYSPSFQRVTIDADFLKACRTGDVDTMNRLRHGARACYGKDPDNLKELERVAIDPSTTMTFSFISVLKGWGSKLNLDSLQSRVPV